MLWTNIPSNRHSWNVPLTFQTLFSAERGLFYHQVLVVQCLFYHLGGFLTTWRCFSLVQEWEREALEVEGSGVSHSAVSQEKPASRVFFWASQSQCNSCWGPSGLFCFKRKPSMITWYILTSEGFYWSINGNTICLLLPAQQFFSEFDSGSHFCRFALCSSRCSLYACVCACVSVCVFKLQSALIWSRLFPRFPAPAEPIIVLLLCFRGAGRWPLWPAAANLSRHSVADFKGRSCAFVVALRSLVARQLEG